MTLDLPPDATARLEAEAARRGITLDQLVAELASLFPSASSPEADTALRKFLRSGDSGDPKWATTDIHELRHELAHRSSEVV